jgi:arylsulfatase A-like enzyme/Tfp pilus assembly protein PilF
MGSRPTKPRETTPPRFSRSALLIAGLVMITIAGAAAFLVVHTSGRIPQAGFAGANVLVITLDTTRADRIGAYGYARAETPSLDRLAAQGLLFEHCITPTAYTLPSHSSIFTGTYPPFHGVRLNGDSALSDVHTTLAEQLKARGYRTGAFVGAFVLDGRWGLEQGFDHFDDDFQLGPKQQLDLAGVQRPASAVTDAALEWIGAENAKPFFAWLHFYDAHTPYSPPEPYAKRFRTSDPMSLYDGEIAFADSQVGRVMQWLTARGLDDNTIVVIVGDHGEGLGSHRETEHGYFIYDYALRVPLIVRLPSAKFAGKRIPSQVRTIDIFPTILELVGETPPATVQGESMWPMVAGRKPPPPRYAYSESMATRLQYGWSALYSIRSEDYKYIEAPRAELYDLRADPGETSNRLDDLRRVAHELRASLRTIRDDAAKGAPKATEANLDAETVAKLASLGYLGGGVAADADDRDLPDPKDKLHLWEAIAYAANRMIAEDYKDAVESLQIVLADDPEIPQAQLLLASAYRKTGQTPKAKEILDAFLRKDAGNPRALITMAEILSEEGRGEEVIAICRRAIAKDEKNARAWELMADVYINSNDHQNALPLLRKVVEIQPKLSRSRNNLAASLIAVGRTEEAEPLLNETIATNPKFPLAQYHLGLLRENQGRLSEARAAYEAELANHPQAVVARFNLGNLLLRSGDRAGAEQQMRTAIEHDPDLARAYLLLARVLLDRPGHLDEARRLTAQGLERTNEHELKALGYFLLADIYSRQGRAADLQDALRQARYHRSLVRPGTTPSTPPENASHAPT